MHTATSGPATSHYPQPNEQCSPRLLPPNQSNKGTETIQNHHHLQLFRTSVRSYPSDVQEQCTRAMVAQIIGLRTCSILGHTHEYSSNYPYTSSLAARLQYQKECMKMSPTVEETSVVLQILFLHTA